jgi:hypothetical protein
MPSELTREQTQALARSEAIREKLEADKQTRAKVEAEKKAWLAQNN